MTSSLIAFDFYRVTGVSGVVIPTRVENVFLDGSSWFNVRDGWAQIGRFSGTENGQDKCHQAHGLRIEGRLSALAREHHASVERHRSALAENRIRERIVRLLDAAHQLAGAE